MTGGGVGRTLNSWLAGSPALTFKVELTFMLRPDKWQGPAVGRVKRRADVYLIGALGRKTQKIQLHQPQGHCVVLWQGI